MTLGSVRLRLLLSAALVLSTLNGLALYWTYTQTRQDVLEAELLRIQAIAVSTGVSGHPLGPALEAYPDPDSLPNWSAPEVAAAHEALAKTARDLQLPSPITTMRLRDSHRDVVRSAPDIAHLDAMEFVVTSAESPYWRHTYQYLPEMGPALFHAQPSRKSMYVDQHGSWVSAYAPLLEEGRVVGLVAVDSPTDALLDRVRDDALRQAVLFGALFGGALLGIGWLGLRLARGLTRLERAALRLGDGDVETPIAAGGELQSLAVGLERARGTLRRRQRELAGVRRDLEARLELLEGGLTDADLTRRRALEDATLEPRLQAPGSEPRGVTLVDLQRSGACLRVVRNTPVDMPPGAPLRLLLRELELRLRVRDRTEAGPDALLECDLLNGAALADLPPALRGLVDPRKALRVRAPADLQAALIGPRRVAARVLDLSATGAALHVDAHISQVCGWGRRLTLELEDVAGEGAQVCGVVVRRVRTQDRGTQIAVEYQLDARVTRAFEQRILAIVRDAERRRLAVRAG